MGKGVHIMAGTNIYILNKTQQYDNTFIKLDLPPPRCALSNWAI